MCRIECGQNDGGSGQGFAHSEARAASMAGVCRGVPVAAEGSSDTCRYSGLDMLNTHPTITGYSSIHVHGSPGSRWASLEGARCLPSLAARPRCARSRRGGGDEWRRPQVDHATSQLGCCRNTCLTMPRPSPSEPYSRPRVVLTLKMPFWPLLLFVHSGVPARH